MIYYECGDGHTIIIELVGSLLKKDGCLKNNVLISSSAATL